MDLRELPESDFQRHPWEVARAGFFRDLLGQHGALGRPISVLDVGAGDAFLGQMLLSALPGGSNVVCFDAHYDARHLATLTGSAPPGITFTADRPAREFDLMLLLDVIEHVPDDRGFLGDLVARTLAPGGLALVSVPAWMALFTAHDVGLGHHRRYSPGGLRRVMRECALEIVSAGGLFSSLLVPRAARKLGELLRGTRTRPDPARAPERAETDTGSWRQGPRTTALVRGALTLDGRVSRALASLRLQVPGLSTWALGRKR